MENQDTSFRDHFDISSIFIIIITVVLFSLACYLKGLTHDILLEAGVFLASVKLIHLSYKASVTTRRLEAKIDRLLSSLSKDL